MEGVRVLRGSVLSVGVPVEPAPAIRLGCIGVGNKRMSEHTVVGFDVVMGELQSMIYQGKLRYAEKHLLQIRDAVEKTIRNPEIVEEPEFEFDCL